MKILGIGVDIIKNKRIALLIKNKMFIERTFGKNELVSFKKKKNNTNYLAKRITAKVVGFPHFDPKKTRVRS